MQNYMDKYNYFLKSTKYDGKKAWNMNVESENWC